MELISAPPGITENRSIYNYNFNMGEKDLQEKRAGKSRIKSQNNHPKSIKNVISST